MQSRMSRPTQLPPRAPLQRKSVQRPTHDSSSSFGPPGVNEYGNRHRKSFSQGATLDDQPAWFDDLLKDSESGPKKIFHCRSASDSVALFDGIVPNIGLSGSHGDERFGSQEGATELESSFMYGPNSPRRKSNLEFSESSVLLALSDYVSQSPMQLVEESSQTSWTTNFDLQGDFCSSPSEFDYESKAGKRHPGQRSRARKLQYISELERTVNVFEALESELTVRCSTLLKERAVLSMENCKLKQQVARLQQQKLMKDGEYQTLRKEAERLKLGLASFLSSSACASTGSVDMDSSGILLDWRKLHL